jgi:hypothetical protein
MANVVLCIALVLAIIYVVPVLVYGLGTVVAGLKAPEGVSPSRFLVGVLVSKLGTAIAFVLVFCLARGVLSGQWLVYSFLWWISFLTDEIGQTIGFKYSWKEAIAGVTSETIYLPLSAYLTNWLIGVP